MKTESRQGVCNKNQRNKEGTKDLIVCSIKKDVGAIAQERRSLASEGHAEYRQQAPSACSHGPSTNEWENPDKNDSPIP